MRPALTTVRMVLRYLTPWLFTVAVWYGVLFVGIANAALVPSPHHVFKAFLRLAMDGLLIDLCESVKRVSLGVCFGVTLALPVGVILGWYRVRFRSFDILINFFRALPPIALLPLIVVHFGIGESARIITLTYASFFSSIVVISEGTTQINPIYAKAAKSLGATEFEVLIKILAPCLLPHIYTASRLSLGIAWATLVASELIAAYRGLGAVIQRASSFFQLDVMYVGIICIGFSALLMDYMLRLAFMRLLRWQDQTR